MNFDGEKIVENGCCFFRSMGKEVINPFVSAALHSDGIPVEKSKQRGGKNCPRADNMIYLEKYYSCSKARERTGVVEKDTNVQ